MPKALPSSRAVSFHGRCHALLVHRQRRRDGGRRRRAREPHAEAEQHEAHHEEPVGVSTRAGSGGGSPPPSTRGRPARADESRMRWARSGARAGGRQQHERQRQQRQRRLQRGPAGHELQVLQGDEEEPEGRKELDRDRQAARR